MKWPEAKGRQMDILNADFATHEARLAAGACGNVLDQLATCIPITRRYFEAPCAESSAAMEDGSFGPAGTYAELDSVFRKRLFES